MPFRPRHGAGFVQEARRQRVCAGFLACKLIVVAFQVVDAFASLHHVGSAEFRQPDERRVLLRIFLGTFGKRAELAQVKRIAERVNVLQDHQQLALALPRQRIRLEADYAQFAGRGIAAQVARAAIARRIPQAHPLQAAWIVGRDRLAAHRHRQFRVAKVRCHARCAFCQNSANVCPQRGLVNQFRHLFVVAPVQRHRAVIPALADLHIRRQDVTHLDGVHPILVALVDHESDGFLVVIAAVGAKRPRGFIFVALGSNLLPAILNLNLFLARHRAGVARRFVHQDRLADVLAADQFSRCKRGLLTVARGQRANAGSDVHEHVRSIQAQPALARGRDVLLVHNRRQRAAVRLFEPWMINRLREFLLSLDDDGLQFLRAAHRARTAAARRAVILVDPCRKPHQVLTRLADRHHREVFFAILFFKVRDGFVRAHAPHRARIVQRDVAIFHIRIHRRLCRAAEDQPVEASPAHTRRRPSALMAVRNRARQRAFGDHCQPTAHVGLRACQRTVHEAEQVIWPQRVNRCASFQAVTHAEPARTDIL